MGEASSGPTTNVIRTAIPSPEGFEKQLVSMQSRERGAVEWRILINDNTALKSSQGVDGIADSTLDESHCQS